jgi:rSAM/selenodomain-associated transferase 2
MSLVSVIIPTLNEADGIERTLTRLSRIGGLELIVSDGGSSDETVSLAERHARVITAATGRAAQMNAGARAASGEILLFLHADSFLSEACVAELRKTLEDPRVIGGAFRLRIESSRIGVRLVGLAANIRTQLTGIPYGDQGLFVRTRVFNEMGGFPELPLMEDLEFSRRLKHYGRRVILRTPIGTSSRRWDREGVWWVTLRNQMMVLLYFLGVPPGRLAGWYRPVR